MCANKYDIGDKEFEIYLAYVSDDSDYVKEFITKFEIEFFTPIESSPLIEHTERNRSGNDHNYGDSSDKKKSSMRMNYRSNPKTSIYCEKRNALPHWSQIEQMGEAIFIAKTWS